MRALLIFLTFAVVACSTTPVGREQRAVTYAQFFDLNCAATIQEVCVERGVESYIDAVPRLLVESKQRNEITLPASGVRLSDRRNKTTDKLVLEVVAGEYQMIGRDSCCATEEISFFLIDDQELVYLDFGVLLYDPG